MQLFLALLAILLTIGLAGFTQLSGLIDTALGPFGLLFT